MSRRSVITIKVEVTMRLPPGGKPKDALANIDLRVKQTTLQLSKGPSLTSIDPAGVSCRLISRSTTYL